VDNGGRERHRYVGYMHKINTPGRLLTHKQHAHLEVNSHRRSTPSNNLMSNAK
jgi:hypothetical protein